MGSNITVAKRLKEIDRCWLKKGEHYYFHDTKKTLPCIADKYQEVLEKLKIPYFKYEVDLKKGPVVYCQYHHPRFYQEKEEKLPVYEFKKDDGCYHFLGNRKGMIPTEACIDAAFEMKKLVDKEADNLKISRQLPILQNAMDGKLALYITDAKLQTRFLEGKFDKYFIFTVKNQRGNDTGEMIIFDLEKIRFSTERYISIEFPEMQSWKFEQILGKNNKNAERWAEKVGRPISVEYYE